MRALWCSRHKPLPAQVKELSNSGITLIVLSKSFFQDAEEVISLAKKYDCQYIIPILPLTMIARICELAEEEGLTVLFPVMEELGEFDEGMQVDWERDAILNASGKKKVVRFKGFKKIKDVKLVLEDW